jgi:hypothetical protein
MTSFHNRMAGALALLICCSVAWLLSGWPRAFETLAALVLLSIAAHLTGWRLLALLKRHGVIRADEAFAGAAVYSTVAGQSRVAGRVLLAAPFKKEGVYESGSRITVSDTEREAAQLKADD